jgi:ferritin-like metal-binding protein YciE
MSLMTSPRELFIHELKDMYFAEKTLTQVLPKLASEASDRELAQAFKSHHTETLKQVQNLERVFQQLGRRAEGEQCPGIEGIKKEHDEFLRDNEPTEKVRDVFLTGAGSRAEHYEIAAYTGLIGKARALGERESVKLLEQNLKQEKDALKKVESISKRILKEAAGPAKRASNGRRRASSGTTRRTTAKRTTRSTTRRSTSRSSR